MRKGRRERMRKEAIVSSSPQDTLLKCHGVKQNAKICAIGEQNVIN